MKTKAKHDWNDPIDPDNLSWQFVAAFLGLHLTGQLVIAAHYLGWLQ